MSPTMSLLVWLTSVCREEAGAQCLVLCSPMAPPPLLPALCYDHALYHLQFVTFADDICSYTAQSLCGIF